MALLVLPFFVLIVVLGGGVSKPKVTFRQAKIVTLNNQSDSGPLSASLDTSGDKIFVAVPRGSCFSNPQPLAESLIGVLDFNGNLLQSIKLPNWILDLKIAPNNHYLFVSNSFEDQISVFDPASLKLLKTIPAGPNPTQAGTNSCRGNFTYKPQFLVFSFDGKKLLATDGKGGTVTIIDAEKLELKKLLTVDSDSRALLWGIAAHPQKPLVYVGGKTKNKIYVIDTENEQVLREIKLGESVLPFGLAVDPRGEFLYVADSRNGELLIVNLQTEKVVKTITFSAADGFPEWITIGANGKEAFIAHFPGGTVSILDLAKQEIIGRLQTHGSPLMVVTDRLGKRLLTTNRSGKEVTIWERK